MQTITAARPGHQVFARRASRIGEPGQLLNVSTTRCVLNPGAAGTLLSTGILLVLAFAVGLPVQRPHVAALLRRPRPASPRRSLPGRQRHKTSTLAMD